MSSEAASASTPASESQSSSVGAHVCDVCDLEPAVLFCVGFEEEECREHWGGDDVDGPFGFCESCAFDGTDHDVDPLRCAYHSVYEWTFEEAFNKFGFNEGGTFHVNSYVVADAIVNAGYVVVMDNWGMHNLTITQIIRPNPGVEPKLLPFDAGGFVILTPERVAEYGIQVYPPPHIPDYRVGGYDPRPVYDFLPQDILTAINNFTDFVGFVKLDLGPEGRRVLHMRGGRVAMEAFSLLKPDDVICGICRNTREDEVTGILTRARAASLKRLLAVPRCESEVPHLFHRACLKAWLSHSPIHVHCPICKSVVVGEATEEAKSASQETDV